MKTSSIRLIGLLIALLPLGAAAQQNIIKAFDAIIDCDDANVTEKHFLERNPETGIKTGQSDVYTFTLPESRYGLVKDVLKAFRTDNEHSFSMGSGTLGHDDGAALAVGNGKKNNVEIAEPGWDYMYSCFLAPKDEDPDGNYRYAYAIGYKRADNGTIEGRLAVTYATTLKYRQTHPEIGSVSTLANLATWGKGTRSNSWFADFMKYVSALNNASTSGRPMIVGYIYDITQDFNWYVDVSKQDKATAREVLKALLADERNADPLVQKVLQGAIENLK